MIVITERGRISDPGLSQFCFYKLKRSSPCISFAIQGVFAGTGVRIWEEHLT